MSDRARQRRAARRRIVGLEKAAIRRELVDAEAHQDFDAINDRLYPAMGQRVKDAVTRSRSPFALPRRLR